MRPGPGLGALLALSAALGGCAPEGPQFSPVADVTELMVSVLEPAAEIYWDAVGTVIDQDGVTEIAPTTAEEWEAVRNAAFVIAEAGNLLIMEGRALDRGPWVERSREMIEAGRRALAAAEIRSEAGVFDAGAEVYYACRDCHAAYATETLRPSDPESGG